MEILWEALGSSATICWLVAQLLALLTGRKDPLPVGPILQRGLRLLSSVLYVVSLILLAQMGFEGRWPLFFASLGFVILFTVGFGFLRYSLYPREKRSAEANQGKESDVHPR